MKAYYCFVGHPWDSGVVLVFAASLGKAQYAAAQFFEVHFMEVTVYRCGGYDRFATKQKGDQAVLFVDNEDCVAAGIPLYFDDIPLEAVEAGL